jgi:inosine/xanthosine triphosphate pyrophosphatase family protein
MGEERTFAEMPLTEKNLVSHRGKAIKSLARQLR